MIKLNGTEVALGNFPDGTMLIKQEAPESNGITLEWFYENDRELVALIFLANHLKAHGKENINLYMPYIPNARQDRVKSGEDVFTLKYFADIINGLGFKTVTVLDPHSSVSEALIDNIVIQKPKTFIEETIKKLKQLRARHLLCSIPTKVRANVIRV